MSCPLFSSQPLIPVLSLVLALFFACSRPQPAGAPGPDTYKAAIQTARDQKDREFKHSPTSPLAAAARLTAVARPVLFLTGNPGELALAETRAEVSHLAFNLERERWSWHPLNDGARATVEGKPAVPGLLIPGTEFTIGRQTLAAYPSPALLALIVFDPDRPMIRAFQHLLYYAPNPAFAPRARLEKFPVQETVKLLTSRNLEKRFIRHARLHFTLDGKALALTAFLSPAEAARPATLFIPFRDLTTGAETYPTGRFLELPYPAGDTLLIDFNLAFNPLCNYSGAYNCPLPPAENTLEVAIEAGEKTFPH